MALIEYKIILAALIDSEQMLLSIETQLCTRRECKTFRPRRLNTWQLVEYEGLYGAGLLYVLLVLT